MTDDAFWTATERAEERFCGTNDTAEFRRTMTGLGHPADVINERIQAINEDRHQ